MRSTLVILFLSLAVGGVYLVKSREHPAAPTASASATAKAPVSEHTWPKNASTRVDEVKRQVAQHRKETDGQ